MQSLKMKMFKLLGLVLCAVFIQLTGSLPLRCCAPRSSAHTCYRSMRLSLTSRPSSGDVEISQRPPGASQEDAPTSDLGVQVVSDTSAGILSNLDEKKSLFVLNLVALLWGTQHVCIKSSIEAYDSTSTLNFWRFLLSSLLFSKPLVGLFLQRQDHQQNSALIRAGVELGLWTFIGFSFQVQCMQSFFTPHTHIHATFELINLYRP